MALVMNDEVKTLSMIYINKGSFQVEKLIRKQILIYQIKFKRSKPFTDYLQIMFRDGNQPSNFKMILLKCIFFLSIVLIIRKDPFSTIH